MSVYSCPTLLSNLPVLPGVVVLLRAQEVLSPVWASEFVLVMALSKCTFFRSCSLLFRGLATHTWGDQGQVPVERGQHLHGFLEISFCISSSDLKITAVRFPEFSSMFYKLSKNFGICLCPILWTAVWKQASPWRLILCPYFSMGGGTAFFCFFQMSEKLFCVFFSGFLLFVVRENKSNNRTYMKGEENTC